MFVQLVMLGMPGMVFEAQIPSRPVPVGRLTGLGDEDELLDGNDELVSLGAVGESALVSLF
jgi:hypothetical protein